MIFFYSSDLHLSKLKLFCVLFNILGWFLCIRNILKLLSRQSSFLPLRQNVTNGNSVLLVVITSKEALSTLNGLLAPPPQIAHLM